MASPGQGLRGLILTNGRGSSVGRRRHTRQFVRLDGTLSQIQRERALVRFNSEPDCTVFLVSLRAGGVGLNLTSADRCFVMDLWCAPKGGPRGAIFLFPRGGGVGGSPATDAPWCGAMLAAQAWFSA